MVEEKEETIKTEAEIRHEEYEKLKAENDLFDAELLRREKLKAEIARGGQSNATVEPAPEFTEEELAAKARVKAIGQAGGAQWAKD